MILIYPKIIEDFYNLTKTLKIYDKIFLDGDGNWQESQRETLIV